MISEIRASTSPHHTLSSPIKWSLPFCISHHLPFHCFPSHFRLPTSLLQFLSPLPSPRKRNRSSRTPLRRNPQIRKKERQKEIMEALKLRLLAFLFVFVVFAASMVGKADAADAPVPAPASDASLLVPTLFASFTTLLFGILFC